MQSAVEWLQIASGAMKGILPDTGGIPITSDEQFLSRQYKPPSEHISKYLESGLRRKKKKTSQIQDKQQVSKSKLEQEQQPQKEKENKDENAIVLSSSKLKQTPMKYEDYLILIQKSSIPVTVLEKKLVSTVPVLEKIVPFIKESESENKCMPVEACIPVPSEKCILVSSSTPSVVSIPITPSISMESAMSIFANDTTKGPSFMQPPQRDDPITISSIEFDKYKSIINELESTVNSQKNKILLLEEKASIFEETLEMVLQKLLTIEKNNKHVQKEKLDDLFSNFFNAEQQPFPLHSNSSSSLAASPPSTEKQMYDCNSNSNNNFVDLLSSDF